LDYNELIQYEQNIPLKIKRITREKEKDKEREREREKDKERERERERKIERKN
jgi:hypothetical protein